MLICSYCFTALRCLDGEELVDSQVNCPSCDSAMEEHAESRIDASLSAKLKIRDLTRTEFLCVACGGDLPTDLECTVENVVAQLLGSPVRSVTARGVKGTARSVLDCITLENGVRIYLGASSHGAVVYRIAQRTGL